MTWEALEITSDFTEARRSASKLTKPQLLFFVHESSHAGADWTNEGGSKLIVILHNPSRTRELDGFAWCHRSLRVLQDPDRPLPQPNPSSTVGITR